MIVRSKIDLEFEAGAGEVRGAGPRPKFRLIDVLPAFPPRLS
jgi:hypothetical protein